MRSRRATLAIELVEQLIRKQERQVSELFQLGGGCANFHSLGESLLGWCIASSVILIGCGASPSD